MAAWIFLRTSSLVTWSFSFNGGKLEISEGYTCHFVFACVLKSKKSLAYIENITRVVILYEIYVTSLGRVS